MLTRPARLQLDRRAWAARGHSARAGGSGMVARAVNGACVTKLPLPQNSLSLLSSAGDGSTKVATAGPQAQTPVERVEVGGGWVFMVHEGNMNCPSTCWPESPRRPPSPPPARPQSQTGCGVARADQCCAAVHDTWPPQQQHSRRQCAENEQVSAGAAPLWSELRGADVGLLHSYDSIRVCVGPVAV